MPGYYTPETTKVTMEKYGREDQYVVFRNFDSREYGRAQEFLSSYAAYQKDGETVDPEIMERLGQDIISNIVEWHMTEHPVTGDPMEKPKNIEDLRTLPFTIVMQLAEGLMGGAEIPKGTSM